MYDKHNGLPWREHMLEYLSLDIICSSKLATDPRINIRTYFSAKWRPLFMQHPLTLIFSLFHLHCAMQNDACWNRITRLSLRSSELYQKHGYYSANPVISYTYAISKSGYISEVSVFFQACTFWSLNSSKSRVYFLKLKILAHIDHTSRPTWSFKNKPWHDWHWLDAENMIDWLSVSPRTCLFRVTIMFVSFITVRSIIFVFLVMASVFSTFPPTYPAEWSINSLLIITK